MNYLRRRGSISTSPSRAAVFQFVIGNADAHGKNYSFLYGEAGARLAPLYG